MCAYSVRSKIVYLVQFRISQAEVRTPSTEEKKIKFNKGSQGFIQGVVGSALAPP